MTLIEGNCCTIITFPPIPSSPLSVIGSGFGIRFRISVRARVRVKLITGVIPGDTHMETLRCRMVLFFVPGTK